MHFGRKRYMFQKNKNTRKTTKILKNFYTNVSSISFEKTNQLALLLKFEKMIRLSTRQQMVGGGGSPQKSSTMLMNNGSNSMMIDNHNHHHHHNGNHQNNRFRNKKHDSLQQQQQSNNVNSNHKANNNHHVKFRSSPQHHHHNHQQYQHNHHAKINRTSPLKELQASNSNVKKFYDSLNVDSHYHHHQQHNHHHSIIDSNNKTEMMKDLFAGSKSLVTPSPSDLPKPPQNWMKIMNDNNNNVNVSDGIINNNIVNNLDKTKNDDCQISSNGSNPTKTSIKFEDLLELKAMDTIVRSIGANVVNCSDSMMIKTRSKKQQSSPKIMAMFKQQSPQSIAMANNRLIKQY
ncbi:uncharacterized protein LOC113797637 [Dermatophagoides pteronyssinus]|uniref:uncharacterized protein LOC113797637 n=1 Tax=Dermatophagoides pteronyssinus TaxID=6956 RepID=UPI003F678206